MKYLQYNNYWDRRRKLVEDKKICIIADNISNYRYISDLSIRLSKKML